MKKISSVILTSVIILYFTQGRLISFECFWSQQARSATENVNLGYKKICIEKIAMQTMETLLLVTTGAVKKLYTNLVS